MTVFRDLIGQEGLAIARGGIGGAQPFGAYGILTTTTTDTSGVIWPNGAYNFPPAAGLQMSVVSTSAQDGVGGTGIRSIDIHYLDADLSPMVETVTMNGLTPVLTVATNIRFIQGTHMLTFGSGRASAGSITISNGGVLYAEIGTGNVIGASSVRMVPAGKRLLVTSFYGGTISGSSVARSLVELATPTYDVHDFTADSVFVPIAAAPYQDSSNGLTIPCPIVFTEGQSLGMIHKTDKAATIAGSWFGWLENV